MNEEVWLTRVRERLDASIEEVDAVALARLRSARHRALAKLATRKSVRSWLWQPVLPVLATFGIAVLGAWLWKALPDSDPLLPEVAATEFELVLANEASLEFYRDLEFYLWLEQEWTKEERRQTDDAAA